MRRLRSTRYIKWFVVLGIVALVIGLFIPALAAKPPAGPVQLPGKKIAQFVDPLPNLHVITDDGTPIILEMKEFKSNVMPSSFMPGIYQGTWVWGYRYPGQPDTPDPYIGPVIVATRGNPTEITYVNKLGTTATSQLAAAGFWQASTDQSLHWADPQNIGIIPGNPDHYVGPIPAVPHLHGGEVPPQIDGGPDAWFYDPSLKPVGYDIQGHAYYTKGNVIINTAGNATYRYPNTQEGAPIWFHDHLLGATRLNVYAGLAGAYLIQDPPNDPAKLPGLIPLVIQDRMFDTNGELFFPNVGINPPEHLYWIPEFVGDTIVVNGKVWPYQTVDRQRYTFLLLNGSNARAYDMFLQDQLTGVQGPPMWVIGTDGGYLDKPVLIDPAATGQQKKAGVQKSLVIMPGERYTVIVDFNDAAWIARITAANGGVLPPTVNLLLRNTAKTPYPGGAPAIPGTTGRIMQFQVNMAIPGTDPSFDPATPLVTLRGGVEQGPAIVRLPGTPLGQPVFTTPGPTQNVQLIRQLTLNEVMGAGGPLEVLVNNTLWDGSNPYGADRTDFTPLTSQGETYLYSELPNEGETEIWEIINLTADAHPIHLHLVQFQLQSRQPFDVKRYTAAYNAAFPGDGGAFPAGVFMPGYGPPLTYTAPNTDGAVGGNPPVASGGFLKGAATPPLPSEDGWKDTVIMYPGEVTRIVVRWAPTDLLNTTSVADAYYPFDPNGGHGYVWHCHIIDHEDNEMMRPTSVIANTNAPAPRAYQLGVDY